MTSRHVRAYRALLRVYPRRFRADYRDEMTRLFADQLRDARATAGGVGVLRLWVRSLVDLVATAPGQHLGPEEVLVSSPAGALDRPRVTHSGRSRRGVMAVALTPLWLFAALQLAAPGNTDPVFANPPAVLGLPAGIVVQTAALAWMAIGVGIVLATRRVVGWILALVLFATPATALVGLTPPVVLVIRNLAI